MTANQDQQGTEITDPAAYRRRLDSFLGDQDPIAVLSQTADTLARITEQNTAQLLRSRPFPGKWTPLEVLGHLTDSEWVYGFRMRLILCEDQPTILGMDQDLWVAGQKHNDREPLELVEMFRALRAHNLALLRPLGAAELARVGRHNERGDESLGLLRRMLAGHDLLHVDQINRYLDAARQART